MNLRDVGKRFEITFTRDDGRRFNGFIYAPPASQTKSTTFITHKNNINIATKLYWKIRIIKP